VIDTLSLTDILKQIRAGALGVAGVTNNGDGTHTIAFKAVDGTTTVVTRTFNPSTGIRT
jgi:hypothetical protein